MTKKKVIIILLIIALALPLGITFSKYAYTFINNYLMEANNFFFNSDKLSQKGITYNINNWTDYRINSIYSRTNLILIYIYHNLFYFKYYSILD